MASLQDTAVVTGMSAIGEQLQNLTDNVKEKVAKAGMLEAAKVGLAAIQTEEPIRTGTMYRYTRIARRTHGLTDATVQYVAFVKTAGKAARKGTIKRSASHAAASGVELPYYWFFVEFGTSKMHARPFMLTGFLKSADDAAGACRDYAEAALHRLVK